MVILVPMVFLTKSLGTHRSKDKHSSKHQTWPCSFVQLSNCAAVLSYQCDQGGLVLCPTDLLQAPLLWCYSHLREQECDRQNLLTK